jgi:predicted enzyme related to lactoylglutathione lyase
MQMKHTMIHFEIPADDIERAKEFYSWLFGWQFSTPPGFDDYWVFDTGDPAKDVGGGILSRQAAGQGIVQYIQVEGEPEPWIQRPKMEPK